MLNGRCLPLRGHSHLTTMESYNFDRKYHPVAVDYSGIIMRVGLLDITIREVVFASK